MMSWTLVEPCCGSAAVTMHSLGSSSALVPYQGTKWSLRRQLDALLVRLGGWGQPSRIVLSDASWWADAIATVLTRRDDVADVLWGLVVRGEEEPAELFEQLKSEHVPEDPIERAAVLLWLQRMNFASKAVGDRDGGAHWVTHGLNTTSAYDRAGTDRFGEVKPLGRALLRAVEQAPQHHDVRAERGLVTPRVDGPTVVVLDPPYAGTQDYPSGTMTRDEVVDYARWWRFVGARVVVCEAEPIAELTDHGWQPQRLRRATRGQGQQPFRRATRGEEWVTISPGRAP